MSVRARGEDPSQACPVQQNCKYNSYDAREFLHTHHSRQPCKAVVSHGINGARQLSFTCQHPIFHTAFSNSRGSAASRRRYRWDFRMCFSSESSLRRPVHERQEKHLQSRSAAFFGFPPTTSAVAPTSSLVFFLMLHTLACGSKLPTPWKPCP